MTNKLKLISNEKDGFVNLKRLSHFQLDEPSVTVRENNLNLSVSAINKLNLRDYKNCYVSLRNCTNPQEAEKVYLRPNNDPETDGNCKIAFSKHPERSMGASIAGFTTLYRQVDRLSALLKKSRKERRVFLKKCEETGFWYMPLVPGFEYKIIDFKNIKEVKAIYRLILRNRIQNIGETNNLGRRIKEKEVESIPFDTIEYSLMNNCSDDDRRNWESYHIEKYRKEYGDLPPHNKQSGRRLDS
tara:strand:+ start:1353 stop:2081 length:729 start_codon:yes stop_codon:yes gene_type:complete